MLSKTQATQLAPSILKPEPTRLQNPSEEIELNPKDLKALRLSDKVEMGQEPELELEIAKASPTTQSQKDEIELEVESLKTAIRELEERMRELKESRVDEGYYSS